MSAPHDVTGRPAPLRRHTVLETSELDEARDAVERIFLPHDLTSADEHLRMTLNAVPDRHLTLGYLTYHASARLDMPPTDDSYIVNLTTAGGTDASRSDGARERTSAGERGLVLSPVRSTSVHWTPEAEQLHLKIPRRSLELHLGDLLGRPVDEVLDVDFGLDLAGGAGRSLLNAVRFLADELDHPNGLSAIPLARQQFQAFVLTQLLHAARHQYTDALRAPAEAVRFGRLAPVVDYIQAHADEPLTPNQLARVGYMSVRTLYASFQQTFGESPMAYLRRTRLDHVRAELRRSDPATVLVTDVAMRWGFFHESRFAQQYRQHFGELPSQTLRS